MAQFLRPDGNITQTSFTGGFAEIDEASASDADFAYGANNTAAVLEVSLTNPNTPDTGTRTIRYRIAQTNNGTVDGAGNTVGVTAALYQGTTLISADTERTTSGTWTTYSWNPDTSSVTDWNDLRLRFTTTASGGAPANRRGGAVSWAEMEVPDAPAAVNHATTGALSAGTGALAGTASSATDRTSTGALTAGTGALAGTASSATDRASTGALTAGTGTLAGTAARVGVSAALTGTITASVTEADIVAGGKTIILTLTGDTWIP